MHALDPFLNAIGMSSSLVPELDSDAGCGRGGFGWIKFSVSFVPTGISYRMWLNKTKPKF